MGFTALEWRKEISARVGSRNLLKKLGVSPLDGRMSRSLETYPHEAQMAIMARLKVEIEPTIRVDENGDVI